MDEESEEVNESDNSQTSGLAKKGADAAANKAKQAVADAAKKGAKKAVGGQAGVKGQVKRKILTALFPVPGIYIIIAIVAIIVIVGIVMFFVSAPAMFTGKLKDIVMAMGKFISHFFGADTTEMVSDDNIYEALDYIKESGYTLKGDGFLTDYYDDNLNHLSGDDTKLEDSDVYANQSSYYYDPSDGGGIWRSNEDDSIALADSDYVFQYIVSDNYCYTLANYNIATQTKSGGFWGGVANILEAIGTAIYKFYNFFYGPVFDALGITNATIEQWGNGLIVLYHENGFGIAGSAVNLGSAWGSGCSVKIDPDAKTMTLKRTAFLNSNREIEYSLDGWTGRYGMPLEFLVSVHKATGMPDLAYDMSTSFNTRVNIYLHETGKSNVETSVLTPSGEYVSSTGLDDLIDDYENGILQSTRDNAIKYLVKYGVYTDNGDGTYTASENIDDIKDACDLGKQNNDGNYLAYIPYIAYVGDHWYRDVYFVSQDVHGSTVTPSGTEIINSFVDVDYNYQDLASERWTVYKTDENDNFMWYVLDKDGNYATASNPPAGGDGENLLTDDNGYYYYDGTRDEAIKSGYAVTKKAITISDTSSDMEETLKDLGWSNDSGTWTAYETNSEVQEGSYEPLYESDEDLEATGNSDAAALLYVQVNLAGNVTQKGEGQRIETNAKIKKMFLENTYFKYDGSEVTAEAITRLRFANKDSLKAAHSGENDSIYGPVGEYDANGKYKYYLTATASEDSLNTKVEDLDFEYNNTKYKITADAANTDVDDDVEVIKLEDLVGKVELNTESLSAFSILENMHTLDADYIYRDFKELIVELGYFTKEELTEDIEEQMEFPIPDIGSGGYPDESIDKNENELGTLIHSKGDIDANKAIVASKLAAEIGTETGDAEYVEVEQDEEACLNTTTTTIVADSQTMFDNSGNSLDDEFKIREMINVGSTGDTDFGPSDGSVDVASVSVDEFLEKARAMCEQINKDGYDYCVLVTDAGDGNQHCHHAPVHKNSCGLQKSFAASQENKTHQCNFCCATLVSWALQNVGVMPDSAHIDGAVALANWIENNLDCEVITDRSVEPGDIFCYSGHIDLCGEEIDSGWVKYNGGHYAKIGAVEGEENSCIEHITACPSSNGYLYSLRINWGNKKAEDENYVGFEGNEAVVSPVTGELVDYGVYDDEPDVLSGIINRKNVDYVITADTSTSRDFSFGTSDVVLDNTQDTYTHDKVGYAIIKVIDSESLRKLAAKYGHDVDGFDFSKIVSSSTNSAGETNIIYNDFYENCDTEEQVKDRSKTLSESKAKDACTTIDGYKEFLERYDSAGISGYTILVDGFCPELPDPDYDIEEDYDDYFPNRKEAKDESEYKLTKDSYKKISFNSDGTIKDDDCILINEYESEDDNKMASKAATAAAKAERGYMSASAMSVCYDDTIFVKEGTVLGRTYTDREFIEEFRTDSTYEDLRPTFQDDYEPEYDSETGALLNGDTVIGNYIRTKMINEDSEEVEDVYNYMKLDELTVETQECEFEQLAYFLGCLEEGFYQSADIGDCYGCEVLNDGAGNTTAFGLTKAVYDVVKKEYPNFLNEILSGTVLKTDAQGAFILVLEAAKEDIQEDCR